MADFERIGEFSEEEKDKLPTILDIIEQLSKEEVDNMLNKVGIEYDFLRFDQGKYIEMSNYYHSMVKCLMPGSQSPFTLMRGQNSYYPVCVPSLFRCPKNYTQQEYVLISRILMQEFLNVLSAHPVIQEFRQTYELDGIALAQHYGFHTEYLDITNSKWVAAFFATTALNVDNQYVPIGRDYGNGVGVFYIAHPQPNALGKNLLDRVRMVGFHYFNRPTRQNAIVLPMKEGENFNDNDEFKPIFFRHDLKASQLVYDMSYKQIRFFTEDFATIVARQIMSPDYVFAWSSVEQCREQFNLDYSNDEVQSILTNHNIKWHDGSIPHAAFNFTQMQKDKLDWEQYGRVNFLRRVVHTPLVSSV